MRSDGLGVAGPERIRTALEYGQADMLLLDPAADVDETTRSQLIRRAATTGADVELVENQVSFQQTGDVGALLRYHHGANQRYAGGPTGGGTQPARLPVAAIMDRRSRGTLHTVGAPEVVGALAVVPSPALAELEPGVRP